MSFSKTYKAQLTPKGNFKFPKLNQPDTFKGDTKYKVTLLVREDDPGVPEFIEKLEKIRDEEVERIKQELIDAGKPGLAKKVITRPVFHQDTDKEGEDTGFLAFFAAMKSEYKCKKTGELKQLKPKFFDAGGKKITKAPEIWGGTIGRLGVDIRGSKRPADGAIGTTLYLDAVFLLDLKGPTGGGRGADAYGYEGEDGYEYEESGDDAYSGYEGEDASTGDDAADDNTDF